MKEPSGGVRARDEEIVSSEALTLEEARELLELHVRTTPWGYRGLAKRLVIESFERSGAFDVIFRSFTEVRRAERAHRPFRGEAIDGPSQGEAPAAWDIKLAMPEIFMDEERVVKIPHTESVNTCDRCDGARTVRCSNCAGTGRNRCSTCGGDGRVTKTRSISGTDAQGRPTTRYEDYTVTCGTCNGSTTVTCTTCGGDGRVTCSKCDGQGKLVHFEELHVAWRTRSNTKQIEKTALPDDLVGEAKGVCVLREEEERIEIGRGDRGGGPYRGAFLRVNADVEEAANALIKSHEFAESAKLHRQRLVVRAVPVYEGRYRFPQKSKDTRSFWIYGTDKKVFAPRFPVSPLRVAGVVLLALMALAAIAALYLARL